jgi:hypothetical protein
VVSAAIQPVSSLNLTAVIIILRVVRNEVLLEVVFLRKLESLVDGTIGRCEAGVKDGSIDVLRGRAAAVAA